MHSRYSIANGEDGIGGSENVWSRNMGSYSAGYEQGEESAIERQERNATVPVAPVRPEAQKSQPEKEQSAPKIDPQMAQSLASMFNKGGGKMKGGKK